MLLTLRANRLFKLIYVRAGCCVVLSSKNFVRFALCQSFILIIIDRAAKTACDVDFLVGFESEFILLKSTNPIEPISFHAPNSADAVRSGSTTAMAVADMVHAIELSGIEIQMYHGETAPGQVCHWHYLLIITHSRLTIFDLV